MIKESVTIDDAIDLLNKLVDLDPDCAHRLVETRQPCNAQLADHPSIQCQVREDQASLGLLGVVNGLFGIDSKGYGPIVACYDGDRLDYFKRFQPSEEIPSKSVAGMDFLFFDSQEEIQTYMKCVRDPHQFDYAVCDRWDGPGWYRYVVNFDQGDRRHILSPLGEVAADLEDSIKIDTEILAILRKEFDKPCSG